MIQGEGWSGRECRKGPGAARISGSREDDEYTEARGKNKEIREVTK